MTPTDAQTQSDLPTFPDDVLRAIRESSASDDVIVASAADNLSHASMQPDIRPVGKRRYELMKSYIFCWDNGDESPSGEEAVLYNRLTVYSEPPYQYDGSSVPWLAWSVTRIRPDGLHRAASLVHDWIYVSRGILPDNSMATSEDGQNWNSVDARWRRKDADRLYLQMMKKAEMPKWQAYLAYYTIRLVGGLYWHRRD